MMKVLCNVVWALVGGLEMVRLIRRGAVSRCTMF